MHNDNWDDLRYVLAVNECGSVLQAARRLGVNHATVLRRVTAFEDRHGAALFERTRQGYRLYPDKLPVLRAARAAEAALAEVARLATGESGAVSGAVRITSTDTLTCTTLAQAMHRLEAELGGVRLTLLSSNRHFDFAREAADLAVRPAKTLPDALTGTQVGELSFAVYGAADHRGPYRWLALSGPLARTDAARWMAEMIAPNQTGPGADSFLTLAAMAAQGLGQAVLPRLIGDGNPGLVRLDAGMPAFAVPIWVARPTEGQPTAAVRATEAALIAHLQAVGTLWR